MTVGANLRWHPTDHKERKEIAFIFAFYLIKIAALCTRKPSFASGLL